MRSLLRTGFGALSLIAMAAVLGLTVNALRPNGLPLIRKPLRDTRATVSITENPAPVPAPTPSANPITPPTGNSEPPKTQQPTTGPSDHKKPPTALKPPPNKPNGKSETVKPSANKPVPKPPKKVEALFTTLQDAKTHFDDKSALFLDSRPLEDYEKEHIAGAVWLYYEKLDELYDRVLGKVPKDRLIITYCSDPECTSALKLADALVERGHMRIFIFLEGLPGWKEAGYPTATGKEPGR